MIHASFYKPRIFPVLGDNTPAEIDRAQAIDPTATLNREEIKEIGREDVVGYVKRTPTVAYRLTQYEYGNIEFFQKLINSDVKGNVGEDEIDLDDFKITYFDICAYLTDDDGTFRGTVWYPNLRTSGFSVTIGDPDAIIERGFDFVGESAIIWQGDNKYLIYAEHEAGSASDNVVDLSAKAPAEDPDEAGKYIQRVVRIRSGVSTVLTSSDYSYSDGTKELTITDVQTDDKFKIYYTSATAPDVQFAENNADSAGLLADCVSIYLYIPGSGKPSSSDYLYRLQSVTIDVAFDREDHKEIGNKEVVKRGITNKTVTVTLGRMLEKFTTEEVLRGEAEGFGKIDISKFSDQIALIVKVFDDNTKSTFKYGLKATGLSPQELRTGATVNAYSEAENTLEGENLIISADDSVIGI